MVPSASTISKDDFTQILAEYPALVAAISENKGTRPQIPAKTKPGQKSLQELDTYRYDKAPSLFGTGKQEMTLPDVQALVEWKLRHGKFRPTLMSLVSSNPAALTKSTVAAALELYRANPGQNAQKALDTLAKLRGIGPATASLLLNVHDADRVVFFSDEAYYWLCCGGNKSPIKYNAREYAELRLRAEELADRLGVGMVHVEKVAYVVMKRESSPSVETAKVKSKRPVAKESKATAGVSKRKTETKVEETGLRRSKRQRA